MNEIVVLSGKGGTGKTSVAAALAVLAGTDAVVADCDVDAANMHLLLQPDYERSYDFYSGEIAIIDHDLCTLCGKCEEICRFHALKINHLRYTVSALDCEGCAYCEKVCSPRAITMQARKSGMVYVSNTRTGHLMVHARLGIGSENSGKLVAGVKKDAIALASEHCKELIIVDGPPGIGCPVVASMAGAGYVVLVTESSMSGFHDLERICAVMEKFMIRAGCIINKSDLNEKVTGQIRNFLTVKKIELLAEIPYDNTFTMNMIEGKTIVETPGYLKVLMEDTWIKIKSTLNDKNQ